MKWYLQVLKKYAVFNGRARRSEYWYFALFSILISIALMLVGAVLQIPILDSIYSLAVLLPGIGVAVRKRQSYKVFVFGNSLISLNNLV